MQPMAPQLDNIIDNELRASATYRELASGRLPEVSDGDFALAMKCVRHPARRRDYRALEALTAIGAKASWISIDQQLEVARRTRTPIRHFRESYDKLNRWLVSLPEYAASFPIAHFGSAPRADETLMRGSVSTTIILAGNDFVQAPIVIANTVIADARCIVKPSGIDPIPPFLFCKALLEHGCESPNVLYLDSSSERDRGLVRRAIENTEQSLVFGEDKTVAAVYGALSTRAGHKELPFWSGRSGAIVLADADLELAADTILLGAIFLGGRTCLATKKVFASTQIAGELLRLLMEKADRLTRGAFDHQDTQLGPQPEHLLAVRQPLAAAGAAHYDAELLIVGGVSPESRVIQEEPPFPMFFFVTGDEARLAEMANRSVSGTPSRKAMAMAVFTSDKQKFYALAREIAAFRVILNQTTCPWHNFSTRHQGIHLCEEMMRPMAVTAD